MQRFLREMAVVAAATVCALPCLGVSQRVTEPIRLDDANPHYFRYEGKTIALITSGEHYGSVLNPDFDYDAYLKTLKRDGLNLTRLFGGSYVEEPGTSFGIKHNTLAPAAGRLLLPWKRSNETGYAGGGNKFDLENWDPEYFTRIDDFLTKAEQNGVVVEISLFSSQYGDVQWKLSPFNAANNVNHTDVRDRNDVNTLANGNVLAAQERYVRKIVHAVNAHPNVIFEIQNEPWSDHPVLTDVVNPYLFPPGRDQYPNSVETADRASIEWQTRVAQWITSEEMGLKNKHLLAQNYTNFFLPVRDAIAGVSVVNFHYAYAAAVGLNYGLEKAIGYDETGFLGNSDAAYLRQAWNFMLAGGSTFDGLDYSFTVEKPDGTYAEPNGPGGGSVALRAQLGFLAKFVNELPLAEMHPDERVVAHADGVTPHALSGKSGVVAMYLDGKGPSKIALKLPAGTYEGFWLDPVTGERTAIAKFKSVGSEQPMAAPSFEHGIAMKLMRDLY